MVVELSQFQRLCHAVQSVTGHGRKHTFAENQRVQCCKVKGDMLPLADIADK